MYPGSQTTPPCEEKTKWIVFEAPEYIKKEELEALKKINSESKPRTT